jgi:hypothetical protein
MKVRHRLLHILRLNACETFTPRPGVVGVRCVECLKVYPELELTQKQLLHLWMLPK